MTQKPPDIPPVKLHKHTGQAYVILTGRRTYLGRFGTPEVDRQYHRAISEWEANGRQLPVRSGDITVVELCARFWTFAQEYYQPPSREGEHFRTVLAHLQTLYGDSRAADFGPLAFKATRQRMVESGWSRVFLNKQMTRVKRVFKWAVENELVPPSTYHGLEAVAGLARGRSAVRETEPVRPVSDDVVNATLSHMTPTLVAMVRVQRATGMRPGELVIMRTGDIDVSGKVWIYAPEVHKTQYRGHSRQVFLGPKAQEAIKPFLRHNLSEYVFSPIRSEDERRAMMREARTTPLSCGNKPGSNRKRHPKWGPGDRYSTDTYAKAIAFACKRAFLAPDDIEGDELKQWHRNHRWSPNQLRHSFGTEVRREHGLEAAQVLLGHSRADVTQIYAERDVGRAIAVIGKVG